MCEMFLLQKCSVLLPEFYLVQRTCQKVTPVDMFNKVVLFHFSNIL